ATSMWICGESFFSTLSEEQQQILMDCADEAGLMNNDLYDEATAEAEQGMKDAGVTVYELTDADKAAWIEASQKFFASASETMGWTEGLYDTVKAIAKG
ncbi:MAG: C4-dicarboxylate ABC transporter substrate-binding protein, partial [Butyricicoccus sp.]|nr:C4-dicarboxylate ABC transporter substrate-binding protein [Butyricicoccus sp.]